MKYLAVAFGLSLALHGCTYAISPEVASRADTTITFQHLQADPDTFKGKLVILGGVIAHYGKAREGTLLEIIQKPLDYWGKPKRTDTSGGRFLLLHPGYLDAMIFAPGREITIAAEVEGTRSKAFDEVEHSYPVVVAKEIKLWEREQKSWDKPQWIDPLYDPDSPAR